MTPTNTLLTSLGLIIIAATLSFAAPPVPEGLTYQLLWEGMRVGSSSIETQRKENVISEKTIWEGEKKQTRKP